MNRNDPRIVKTLRQIDAALLDSIAQYPFQKVTVDMICENALINRSTFYKYYRDKYDLLDKFLSATLKEFSRKLRTDFVLASPTEIGNAFYTGIFHEIVTFLYKKKDKYLILWGADIGRHIYEEMTVIICDNILNKLDSSSADQRHRQHQQLYAKLFASNLMTLVRWGFLHDREVTKEDIESLMRSNMENGLFFTFKQYI